MDFSLWAGPPQVGALFIVLLLYPLRVRKATDHVATGEKIC